MLFNSVHFLVFLPLVLVLYYVTKPSYRWFLLLLASYYFYAAWEPEYLLLIVFSTLIDYFCAIKMERQTSKQKRLPFLIVSLLANLGLLGFFKYYAFANESLAGILNVFDVNYKYYRFEDLLLPVGISFYTFQTLSYSIEVFRGQQKAEKHLGIFALYVSFFPQLVAGPIERFAHLGKQFKEKINFSWSNLRSGLQLVLYGLFVKVCIADNLASIVDPFFANPLAFQSQYAWMASIAYSFQIYGDFFGYTSIAIGVAQMMGFRLMDNFKTPYLSLSITEFWRRWHISLSTWFRDYLYISLGGNRGTKWRWMTNIMLVFLISGLWHGANWTFVIWGAIHGILYLLEKNVRLESGNHVLNALRWLKTYLVVVLAWVFFRAVDFDNAMEVFQALFSNTGSETIAIEPSSLVLFALFVLSDVLLYNSRFDQKVDSYPVLLRWVIYATLIFTILSLGGVENHPFIYFQF